jgi:putative membrane protein
MTLPRGHRSPAPYAVTLAVAAAVLPAGVAAHTGAPLAPGDLARAWNLDPFLLGMMVVAIWVYARGIAAIRRRAANGRGVARWRIAAFGAGMATLAVALISPLDALSGALFSAHMVQHLLLTIVAAPLLALAAPIAPALWAMPAGWRSPAIRALRQLDRSRATLPIAAAALFAGALWLWHMPRFYEAALANTAWHAAEHAAFMFTAMLLWWVVVRPGRRERGAVVLALFFTMIQSGGLGALLTFSGEAWYPAHAIAAPAFGLTALQDQQLAGTIMWVPMGVAWLAAALWALADGLRMPGPAAPVPVHLTHPAARQPQGGKA